MKVIFLDVDGVLNNLEDILHHPEMESPEQPQDKHLQVLKKIIDATGAEVVVSSGWRMTLEGIQDVIDALWKYGIAIRGVTPEGCQISLFDQLFPEIKPQNVDTWRSKLDRVVYDRGAEIASWLYKYRNEIESFLILDDEVFDIQKYYPDHYIKTDPNEGLVDKYIDEAIKILNLTSIK